MVYLSYFNNPRVKKSKRNKYSIALYQFVEMPKASELLVPARLFKKYKNREISFEELCVQYYLLVLNRLNPVEIGEKYSEAILCCHEVKKCHRVMIAHWLNENGIDAKEY